MDWNLIWQAILIVLIGTLLLRIAGRKTISQMTLAETVLMISIGTLLIQPVTSKSVWASFIVGLVLVLTLLFMEFMQLKVDTLETWITGKAKIVIENGQINEKEMAKLRLTVDQLEMYLRQNNVTSISDVKLATLEASGQLGFTLKNDALPATKMDIQQVKVLMQQLMTKQTALEQLTNQLNATKPQNHQANIFQEVKHQHHKNPPPNHLK